MLEFFILRIELFVKPKEGRFIIMDATGGLEISQGESFIDVKSFFESAPPLKNSDSITQKVKEFIYQNSQFSGEQVILD